VVIVAATAGLTIATQKAERIEAAEGHRRGSGDRRRAARNIARPQITEQHRHPVAQLVSPHDLVYEAMLEQELGTLEAGRQ
jgi:hypothetical protein